MFAIDLSQFRGLERNTHEAYKAILNETLFLSLSTLFTKQIACLVDLYKKLRLQTTHVHI